MAAGIETLYIEQGADYFLELEYVDEDDIPVNITGYSVRGDLKSSAQDVTPVASFTCTVTDGPSGRILITLPAEDSSAIPLRGVSYEVCGVFYYDIELYKTGEPTERLLNGIANISPEVTKSV